MILVDDDRVTGAPPTRDRARVLVLVATARVQRVPVVRVGSAELSDSRVDRLLQRMVDALTETADDSALASAFGPLAADKT